MCPHHVCARLICKHGVRYHSAITQGLLYDFIHDFKKTCEFNPMHSIAPVTDFTGNKLQVFLGMKEGSHDGLFGQIFMMMQLVWLLRIIRLAMLIVDFFLPPCS